MNGYILYDKKRRSSSPARAALRDYINAGGSDKIQSVILHKGPVLFADDVLKINKRNKAQERVLVLDSECLYILDRAFSLRNKIFVCDIYRVCLSIYQDNFVILRVRQDHDYLFAAERKSELVCALCQKREELISLNRRFEMVLGKHERREALFTPVEKGVVISLYNTETD